MISGITGIQNTAPIAYNAPQPTALEGSHGSASYPDKGTLGLCPFSISLRLGKLFSLKAAEQYSPGSEWRSGHSVLQFQFTIIQIVVVLIVVFAMTSYVIQSRSPFKGAIASTFSFLMFGSYILLVHRVRRHSQLPLCDQLHINSGAGLFLEFNNVEVVKALEVMKQDFLGKFGEAFQDLTSGAKETLDDVANYDETKKELREAILAPIEHREIAGAYNVKPAKGILLFGPPGTGKTLIMRALANEIRAKFFYVKTSSIVSPFQGQSSQDLSKIFNT